MPVRGVPGKFRTSCKLRRQVRCRSPPNPTGQPCSCRPRPTCRADGIVVVVIAVFAPGQGAQTPGMLSPWLELPGAAEELAEFSEASGLDLVRLGTTADADEIKDTAVTQPLIVALGVLVAGRLGLESDTERVVAGHSVGELTAAAVSGALTPAEAVAFAARRG